MAKSAVLSFAASHIFMDKAAARAGDFTVPLVCATSASVASMIHALVEPFFTWAFAWAFDGYTAWLLEFVKMVIVKSATYYAFLAFLPALRTHLVAQNICISGNFIASLWSWTPQGRETNSFYLEF